MAKMETKVMLFGNFYLLLIFFLPYNWEGEYGDAFSLRLSQSKMLNQGSVSPNQSDIGNSEVVWSK